MCGAMNSSAIDLKYRKANSSALDSLVELFRKEDPDSVVSLDYLESWYGDNPAKSCSIYVCEQGDNIEGVASTNNFVFLLFDSLVLVGMPQKVLTSQKIRGKGAFGALYRHTESENRSNGVERFVTFTNEFSTPIFKKKFGYLESISPDIKFVPSNPICFIRKRSIVERVCTFDDNYLSGVFIRLKNAIQKDVEYLRWRYCNDSFSNYVILSVKQKDKLIGYVVVKKVFKKGIPLMVIVDLVVINIASVKELINSAVRYSISSYCIGVLVCVNELNQDALKKFSGITVKNRLNFLVKGKDQHETELLSRERFNFSFGDMDFI